MSSRPRRGSCNEYCKSMLGAACSSTMPRLHFSPKKPVNQRPMVALLSLSLDMIDHFLFSDCGERPPLCEIEPDQQLVCASVQNTPVLALVLDARSARNAPQVPRRDCATWRPKLSQFRTGLRFRQLVERFECSIVADNRSRELEPHIARAPLCICVHGLMRSIACARHCPRFLGVAHRPNGRPSMHETYCIPLAHPRPRRA